MAYYWPGIHKMAQVFCSMQTLVEWRENKQILNINKTEFQLSLNAGKKTKQGNVLGITRSDH